MGYSSKAIKENGQDEDSELEIKLYSLMLLDH
jgi:hypothetical protein